MLEGHCSFIIYSSGDLKQGNHNGLGRSNQVLLQQLETDYNTVQTFLQVLFLVDFLYISVTKEVCPLYSRETMK